MYLFRINGAINVTKKFKGKAISTYSKKVAKEDSNILNGVQKTGFVKLRNYPLTIRTTCSAIVGKQDSIKTFNIKKEAFSLKNSS